MELKQKLENDLHSAMKSGDNISKQTIRMALSNIKLAEVQKGSPLEEIEILSILQKEIKSRSETILDAEKIKRQDIIDAANSEIKVIELYLPKQMDRNELNEIVKQAVSDVNAQNMNDMGKVMKIVLPKVQGKASNDVVSKVVREYLANIK
jgi:uncharacterized protein